jgi:hypothetical protein
MSKITFEGDEEFIDRMEDQMTHYMMECGQVFLSHACERQNEDYCKYQCPFREGGEMNMDP